MIKLISKVAIIGVAVVSILYQFVFKEIIFDTLGHGRKVYSLKEYYDFDCKKLDVPGLEACEDQWLHEETGYLYMACSTSQSRLNWLPAVAHLDANKRGKMDRIAMLDTRGNGPLSSRLKWLSVENFSGNNGDGIFDLHGISFLTSSKTNMLRILLVNHRPPFDPITGKPLDASKLGANSTIEHFLTEAGSLSIRHVRTHAHPLIQTPNAVAWVSDHSFVFTNDKSVKVGLRRHLDPIIGGGSVVHCDRTRCQTVVSGMKLPNGIIRSQDGLIYVAHMLPNVIEVYSLNVDRQFHLEDTLTIGLPIDNLSIDSEGDIYAATFPKVHKWIESSLNYSVPVPSAIFKVSRGGAKRKGMLKRENVDAYQGEYIVEKILEDNGSVLSGSTSAVHDSKTGRIFVGGVMTPFVVVCEPRKI